MPVVRLLGPVQFLRPDGDVVDLPSASQRRLLALLALYAPRPVRSGFLCQVLDVTAGALRTRAAVITLMLQRGDAEETPTDLEFSDCAVPRAAWLRGDQHVRGAKSMWVQRRSSRPGNTRPGRNFRTCCTMR